MQCHKCGKVAQPNQGKWVVNCGCDPLNEATLLKAIEPVSSWFDADGEEGEPFSIIEIISETAKMAVDDRNECLRLRKALQDIIHHHEIMGGQLSRFSTIRLIAQRALNQDPAAKVAAPSNTNNKD